MWNIKKYCLWNWCRGGLGWVGGCNGGWQPETTVMLLQAPLSSCKCIHIVINKDPHWSMENIPGNCKCGYHLCQSALRCLILGKKLSSFKLHSFGIRTEVLGGNCTIVFRHYAYIVCMHHTHADMCTAALCE